MSKVTKVNAMIIEKEVRSLRILLLPNLLFSPLMTLEYQEESLSHTPGCSISWTEGWVGPPTPPPWLATPTGWPAATAAARDPTYLLSTSGLVSFSKDWRSPHGEKGWEGGGVSYGVCSCSWGYVI